MNPDFDPEQPDVASDPLLAALRQQLGEQFGQAPPPGTWAGIRQRLVPRPWWRRPRYLLPALTLLLSLCTVAGLRVASRLSSTQKLVNPPVTGFTRPLTPIGVAAGTTPAASVASATRPARPALAAAASSAARSAAVTGPASGHLALVADKAAAGLSQPANSAATRPPAALPVAAAIGRGRVVAATTAARPRRHFASKPALPAEATVASAAPALTSTYGAVSRRRAATSRGTVSSGRAATSRRRPLALALATRRHELPEVARTEGTARWQRAGRTGRRGPQAGTLLAAAPPTQRVTQRDQQVITQRDRQLAARRVLPASSLPTPAAPAASSPAGEAVAQLAARPAATLPLAAHAVPLLLPPASQPATLTPLPASGRPLPPFRRWTVQVLAGPTLSYRSVPTTSSRSAGATTTSLAYSTSPGYTSYERPALGWGAQVQLRQVLDGRWAVAMGLGYHQYATRLDLTLRQPGDSLTRTVQLRDTYNLLTVPVQFDYALGAPRGPLRLALLGGAELGWYRGGRVTEGSGCACQQQSFTGAADSPYNAVSLALSLGLDLRYRLGGPAGRWQLLAQPTGRYVATPFVRNDVSGYVRRQPYSLGLLVGLAWDWR